MSRYDRIELPDPATLEVAPHRYLWTGMPDDDERGELAMSRKPDALKRFKELVPYKAGEVVYVVYGDGFAKAYISYMFIGYDHFGDKREYYRVHRLNRDGKAFSKKWYYVYPGQVQRGYQRAGLAPEMPEERRR